MFWLWIGLAAVPVAVAIALVSVHLGILRLYIPIVMRIFQEKPLFIMPFGQPVPDAEDVALATADGLTLQGCYLKTNGRRQGVILFGLEFGSNRWSCLPYTEFLLSAGYDIFAFEMRGQGKSPAQPGYEPLQWVTDFEVEDFQTAIDYLKNRADADSRGIGFFGLSKGGSAGLLVGASDPFVRCFVTDGAFGTYTTVLPYMRQWIFIYTTRPWLAKLLPRWYYRYAGAIAIRRVEKERKVHYPSLADVLPRLAPRPWLMIHGGADNYIKPDMARALFDLAREPKELWIVEGAKHNQAMATANGEYKRRIREFFEAHLSLPAAGPFELAQSSVDSAVPEPALPK